MIIKAWFRLAALESKKESDCITKYILDQYDDDGSIQYAIGEILFKVYSITLGVLMTVRWFVQQKFAGIFLLFNIQSILHLTWWAFRSSFCSGLKMSEEYRGIYEWDASPEPKSVEVWNWRPGSPGGQVCLDQSEDSFQVIRQSDASF